MELIDDVHDGHYCLTGSRVERFPTENTTDHIVVDVSGPVTFQLISIPRYQSLMVRVRVSQRKPMGVESRVALQD